MTAAVSFDTRPRLLLVIWIEGAAYIKCCVCVSTKCFFASLAICDHSRRALNVVSQLSTETISSEFIGLLVSMVSSVCFFSTCITVKK